MKNYKLLHTKYDLERIEKEKQNLLKIEKEKLFKERDKQETKKFWNTTVVMAVCFCVGILAKNGFVALFLPFIAMYLIYKFDE